MIKGAALTEDNKGRKYRYQLWRIWDEEKPKAMCIGLNPSTANDDKDDNTIGCLMIMLQLLGYGGFYMTNLFALVSPHPEDLRQCPDPVKDNDYYLQMTARQCKDVIFCWGAFPQAKYRAKIVRKMFPNALCFGKTLDGSPFHPRALSYGGVLRSPSLKPF